MFLQGWDGSSMVNHILDVRIDHDCRRSLSLIGRLE
jgi:hypothetical protein